MGFPWRRPPRPRPRQRCRGRGRGERSPSVQRGSSSWFGHLRAGTVQLQVDLKSRAVHAFFVQASMTISQVARQVGLRPSAIRYYEQIGVLARATRVSGRRRYDETALHRLALVQRARACGFTLDEIRRLFFGFRGDTPVSERWRRLSDAKLAELAAQRAVIEDMEAT